MIEIESELRSNAFVRLLLESISNGIFVLNPQGNIIAWNRAMEKITGYPAAEILGSSCRHLNFSRCLGKGRPKGMQDCGILNTGRMETAECVLTDRNGKDISIVKTARLIKNAQGRVIGIVEVVTDMTELTEARLKVQEAQQRLGELTQLDRIIAKSQAMQNVFASIRASATRETTVLIQGESGTGKELVAGAIHALGPRRDNPLVIVNCSALTESLLESELFGHVKGAFTSADRDRTGRFAQADGGTIFLDEIGEISPYIQVKLLRVLQEKEIERVGESRKQKIDIRVIAATNKDLKSLLETGQFREDLYYRLKVFPILLPALRDRKEDILPLVEHFIQMNNKKSHRPVRGMEKNALRALMDYSWPGNVRELSNAIEHAFVLCSTDRLELKDLPVEIRNQSRFFPAQGREKTAFGKTGNRLSREMLLQILADSQWNKAEAARRLDLSRASIWKYMKKWDIPNCPPDGM